MASIRLRGITKTFGDTRVLNGIDLEIADGEFLTLVGPSGCGKSTTLRIIAGLETQTAGNVEIDGAVVDAVRPSRRDLAMVFQSYALYPHLTVRQNLATPLLLRDLGFWERFPLLGALVPGRREKVEALAATVREAAGTLEIEHLLDRKPAQLSGGQRQRVALARALVTEPEILLLDEPLSALDANLVVRMQGVLSRLQKDLGITFVYVTHSQSEAFAMADRVVIMSDGRIAQIGSPREVYRNPANRFVAEFVGTNNILTGRVAGLSAERVEIETDLGRFRAARPAGLDLHDGQPVTFVVSADLVHLSDAEAAFENRLVCTPIGEEFVGSMVTLFLETAEGVELKVQTSQHVLERFDLRSTEAMFASWSPEHAHILPGD